MSLAAFSACIGQQVCGRAPSLRSCAGPRLPAKRGYRTELRAGPRLPARVFFICLLLEHSFAESFWGFIIALRLSWLFASFVRVALIGLLRPSLGRAIDPLRGERLSGARLPPLTGCKPPAQAAVAPPLLFFRLPL